jgi:myo-inositol-1(or 4)-monophosphatase
MGSDLTVIRKYATELTFQAGKILKKYFEKGGYSVRQKRGLDFTSQADEETDAFLRKHLANKFPQTHFLTEETAPKEYLSSKNTENLWVIDPLDGTMNFLRKNPYFAISIALVNKGIPQLAVIHLPMTGDIYWAQSDKPIAFVNETPLRVSETTDLREVVLAINWSMRLKERLAILKLLSNISTHVRQIKFTGSSVVDLAILAEGRIDAYLHLGGKPWDVAASSLIVEKAGGKITTPTGENWNVFGPDIFVSNGNLHQRLLTVLNK